MTVKKFIVRAIMPIGRAIMSVLWLSIKHLTKYHGICS